MQRTDHHDDERGGRQEDEPSAPEVAGVPLPR